MLEIQFRSAGLHFFIYWANSFLVFFLSSHNNDNDHEDNNNALFEQHPSPGGPFVPVLLHVTGLSFMFPLALSIA